MELYYLIGDQSRAQIAFSIKNPHIRATSLSRVKRAKCLWGQWQNPSRYDRSVVKEIIT
jgi:hypothetical protein